MRQANNTPKQHPFASLASEEKDTAFKSIYADYAAAILKKIQVIVEDLQLAEEARQDTFIKVWRSMEQYDAGKGTLYTWLVRIAQNAALDTLRQKANKEPTKSKLLSIEDILTLPVNAPVVKDEMGLRKLVAKLPTKSRTPIELVFFQGYTQVEIARELNLALGTVKSRYYNALKKLKKMVKEQH